MIASSLELPNLLLQLIEPLSVLEVLGKFCVKRGANHIQRSGSTTEHGVIWQNNYSSFW